MLRRTFLASSIATTVAGLFAPMLSKLGRKPQTAVCAIEADHPQARLLKARAEWVPPTRRGYGVSVTIGSPEGPVEWMDTEWRDEPGCWKIPIKPGEHVDRFYFRNASLWVEGDDPTKITGITDCTFTGDDTGILEVCKYA